jgi:ABC-type nitrate/sulfonate/bicarbonate transport system substrate-binding protein
VTLARDRPGFHVFRVEQFGAPAYPELVLSAESSRLRAQPGLAAAVVRAFVQGYTVALHDPSEAQADLESLVPGLDHQLVGEQLAAVRSSFAAPDGHVGELYLPALRSWASWEARFGIVSRPPDVAAMFDPVFVTAADGAAEAAAHAAANTAVHAGARAKAS